MALKQRTWREWRWKRDAFMRWWDAWILRYDQYRCPHLFRPARVNDQPGRVCKICEKAEQMTPESFFAHFGERGGFNR
jgi:hypothetical protein